MILSIALYAKMLRNDTQHNTLYDIMLRNDTQHNTLYAIMLSVVMLNVVAPYGPGLVFEGMDV